MKREKILLKELKRCNLKIPSDGVIGYIGSGYINKYKECLFEDEINFLNEYYHQNDFQEFLILLMDSLHDSLSREIKMNIIYLFPEIVFSD